MFFKALGIAAGCSIFAGIAAADYNLTILHTNDIHAQYTPRKQDSKTCTPEENLEGLCYGGAARLATAIADARARSGNSILVDGGDVFRGTEFFEYYRGMLAAWIMNTLKYDAMAAGNHEFDNGFNEFLSFQDVLDFPILVANMDVSGVAGASEKILKSVVIERAGERIALIGVTLEDMYERSYPGTDVSFSNPTEAVQAEVDRFTALGINKIIVLSHLGYNGDKRLAAATHDIDVIVGGHTHIHLLNDSDTADGPYPSMVGNVAVIQTYAYTKYLGELNIRFNDLGEILEAKGDPIFLGVDVAEDPDMRDLVEHAAHPLANFDERIIASSNASIDGDRVICRQQECAMGNLIADAMLASVSERGVQIAIHHSGAINATINQGDVSMRDVKDVLRYGYAVSRFQVSGAAIVDALENGVSGIEELSAGFPQVAGVRFSVDTAAPVGSRVSDVRVAEGGGFVPIIRTKVYGIVSSTRVRQGGLGYTMFEGARYAHDHGPFIYDVVAEYLAKNTPYTPYIDGRIRMD